MREGQDTKAPRVLVTRPALDAQHWVQLLKQNGFLAEAFPLIEIAPLTAMVDVKAMEQVWHTLDRYSALMFVSSNAVSHFFGSKEAAAQSIRAQPAIKDIAKTVRFLAPGPGTAAALRAVGVPQDQIDAPSLDAAQFDSDALWQVIGGQDWAGRRVLIVRGKGEVNHGLQAHTPGRDWLAQQWLAAGASVEFVSVYERRSPRLSAAQTGQAKSAAADGVVWLFSSSEAVANLLSQAGLAGVDWHQSRAIATHPCIAQAARAAGWGVVVESRPALDDIVMCLRSIDAR